MTNGSTEITQKFLERSGLSQYVADAMEIAEVQLWKPRAEVYQYATNRLGLQPHQVHCGYSTIRCMHTSL